MTEELNAGGDAAQVETVVQETAEVVENQTKEPPKEEKSGDPKLDDPWPKSARNKISRLEGAVRKKDAIYHQTTQRLAELEKQLQELTKPKSTEPKEEDFETYGDYLKAVAKHRPEGKPEQVDPKKIQEQAFQQAQQQLYYQQRESAVVEQTQKAMQEIPGFEQMFQEHSDILDSFPPAIEMAFLEADNAPLAFYALAKEGKLEHIAQMTPTRAAYEIAAAQIRGEQMLKGPKVSSAPQPIKGSKGTSGGSKPLTEMSTDELLKWAGT